MTTQCAALDGDWNSFHGVYGDNADLIGILDNVDVPIVVVQRDFKIACFNKAASDVLGLSPSDIGLASRDVCALAAWPRLEEQCRHVIAAGMESRADFRDGDKWFVVRMSPCTKNDHQITGIVLTFTNVTAFRASTHQAIYERECTKAILNTVADPLVVLSADQRIQSGNRAFYTMFRVSRDETQGIALHELGNGAFELVPLRAQLEALFAGTDMFQPIEVNHVIPGKGQRTLLLDARPLSLPGHSERRVLVTFQDITARKQAEAASDLRARTERKRSEEELRRSEAFLAEAQRLSLTGSFSWRVATDEITWSDQLYRIFDFDPSVRVTFEKIASRVHPDDLPEFHEQVERARRHGGNLEFEYRLQWPDHSLRYLHLTAHGSLDAEGQMEYIGAVQDVTERSISEQALSRARADLARVARVTSLGTLTASIAHEVNQPLAGIITNASTCLRMLAANRPNIDGARETVHRTIRDAKRASDVIGRLRALFARKDVAAEPVDLNDAAQEVIALCAGDLQRNRVLLRAEFAKELPLVAGDRVQLQQVLVNLLTNASDAMAAIEDRPKEIFIKTELDQDGLVRTTVRDTGVGFKTEDGDRLFNAFFTTKSDGMGIGLSLSRSIIESHHGRLWAAVNDGAGATFTFALPRESDGPAHVRR
jgi:signal transduction histidine kinase